MNYFADAILQPVAGTIIEITLWIAIFYSSGKASIGGYGREYYLCYALWAAFIARITVNWMYEFRMIDDVDSGRLNTVLTRPMSFYEMYLSQFLGYKVVTTAISLIVPIIAAFYFNLPFHYSRLPLAIFQSLYYLLLVHSMSFLIACAALYINRANSLTIAKNLSLWLLSGELFPLDLIPEPYKNAIISLPFSSAVYMPVGYLTGRVDTATFLGGFWSITLGILFFGFLGKVFWSSGLKRYSGTGA